MSRKSKRTTLPKKQRMRLHLKCPNCLEPTVIYKTALKCHTLTELTQECTNMLCKMRFVSYSEADRILQAPMVLINPDLGQMKLSKLLQDKRLQETMSLLEVSDDESDLKMIEDAMPQGDLFYQRELVNSS